MITSKPWLYSLRSCSFQCVPGGAPDECGPEHDGEAILRIGSALTRAQTDSQPAGYLTILQTETDSIEAEITSTRDKIIAQINEISEEKDRYDDKSTIDDAFIS